MNAKTKQPEQPLAFEDALRRLEAIVQTLEQGEASLEEGLALFGEGVTLSRRCKQLLEEAELRVGVLLEESGEVDLNTGELIEDEDV